MILEDFMESKSNYPLILNTKYLILGLALIVVYFVTRLINLTIIPVFCDEAIYIRWAQVMRAVPSLRFIPLSDGKQPLFMWLVIPFLKVFSDPLVAGRLVSVMSGFGTMVGIGLLSFVLFKNKLLSFLAALLYVITPFTLFFDRMALSDGLLSMFGIWFLLLAVLLIKQRRLDVAMGAGMILGLALLTKSPALFFALMLPLTISFVPFKSKISWKCLQLVGLWLVVYFLGFAIYNILRLGPEFHMIAIRNKDYVYSFSEIFKHLLSPLLGNLKSVAEWYWILLTPVIFLSGIFGICLLLKREFKVGPFLLLWWILPILGQSAIAKVFTARYILFSVPVFLIFVALALGKVVDNFKKNILFIIFMTFILFIVPLIQDYFLLFKPQKAWLPQEEREGYLEMWTAGYGIEESAEYLREIAKSQKVLVGTEGFFGTLPNGLEMYLEGVPNITIIGIGQPVTEISPKLISGLTDSRVFLLVNDSRLKIPFTDRLRLVASYPKAINSQGVQENLLLIEVTR